MLPFPIIFIVSPRFFALKMIFASFLSCFRQCLTLKLTLKSTWFLKIKSSLDQVFFTIFQFQAPQNTFWHECIQFKNFSNCSSPPIIAHFFALLIIEWLPFLLLINFGLVESLLTDRSLCSLARQQYILAVCPT